jgi:hypothetical protein
MPLKWLHIQRSTITKTVGIRIAVSEPCIPVICCAFREGIRTTTPRATVVIEFVKKFHRYFTHCIEFNAGGRDCPTMKTRYKFSCHTVKGDTSK